MYIRRSWGMKEREGNMMKESLQMVVLVGGASHYLKGEVIRAQHT